MSPIVTTTLLDQPRATAAPILVDVHARLTESHHEYGRAVMGFTPASRLSAEDLLQESMIRVWRRLEDVPAEPEHTRRRLFTVARNAGIDAIRGAHARLVLVDLLKEVAAPNKDDTADSVEAMESMRRAFHALSAQRQRILAELYIEGRSLRETPVRLGVPLGTVKSRAFYALRSVRRAIAADEPAVVRPRRGPAPRDGRRPVGGPHR